METIGGTVQDMCGWERECLALSSRSWAPFGGVGLHLPYPLILKS